MSWHYCLGLSICYLVMCCCSEINCLLCHALVMQHPMLMPSHANVVSSVLLTHSPAQTHLPRHKGLLRRVMRKDVVITQEKHITAANLANYPLPNSSSVTKLTQANTCCKTGHEASCMTAGMMRQAVGTGHMHHMHTQDHWHAPKI